MLDVRHLVFCRKWRNLTVILLVTWQNMLKRFSATSQHLQKPGLDLNIAVNLLKLLIEFVQGQRYRFDDYEQIAVQKCGYNEYKDDRGCVRRRKRHHDEADSAEHKAVTQGEFRTTSCIPINDQLILSHRDRLKSNETLQQRFAFLSDIMTRRTDKLRDSAANLVRSYPNDLEPCLVSEIMNLQSFLKTAQEEGSQEKLTQVTMYSTIHNWDVIGAFANVEIALRIYLPMFVTNCTGERSFPKLKTIKNNAQCDGTMSFGFSDPFEC
ncbi:uncharacterized protein LOC143039271 [Oratosquilla oratoria]|uniref:uncharacterized protein LOC143039271 n=1 Tax=Oratosquilla oratoria TaxID=337810 RepID=UPI003F769813